MEMLGKEPLRIKALFIPTAAINAGAIGVLPKCMNDLLKCGVFDENIRVYDLHAGMEIEELRNYDVVYLCGGDTQYLLDRIFVMGVSAGSLIFANNLRGNLGLIDTRLEVHCAEGEKRGKLCTPLKKQVRLTNTSALAVRGEPNEWEIIGE